MPSSASRPLVHRTPGISCEAVPASIRAGAGIRRHLRPSAACGARVGAAESFVSFIPLFCGALLHQSIGVDGDLLQLPYTVVTNQDQRYGSVRPLERTVGRVATYELEPRRSEERGPTRGNEC